MSLQFDQKTNTLMGLYKGQKTPHRIGDTISVSPGDTPQVICGVSTSDDEVRLSTYYNHEAVQGLDFQATIAHLVLVRMSLNGLDFRHHKMGIEPGPLTYTKKLSPSSSNSDKTRRMDGGEDRLGYYFAVNTGLFNVKGERNHNPLYQFNALLKEPMLQLNDLRVFPQPFGNTFKLNAPMREVGEALYASAHVHLDLSELSQAEGDINIRLLMDDMRSEKSPIQESNDFPVEQYVALILRYQAAFEKAGIVHNRYFQLQLFPDLNLVMLRGTYVDGTERIRAFRPDQNVVLVSPEYLRHPDMSLAEFMSRLITDLPHIQDPSILPEISSQLFLEDMELVSQLNLFGLFGATPPIPPILQPISEDYYLVRYFIPTSTGGLQEQVHLAYLSSNIAQLFSFDQEEYGAFLEEYFEADPMAVDVLGILSGFENALDRKSSHSQHILEQISQFIDTRYFTQSIQETSHYEINYEYLVIPCLLQDNELPILLPGSFNIRFNRSFDSDTSSWSSFSAGDVYWVDENGRAECETLLHGAWLNFTQGDVEEDEHDHPDYDENNPFFENGFKPMDQDDDVNY